MLKYGFMNFSIKFVLFLISINLPENNCDIGIFG